MSIKISSADKILEPFESGFATGFIEGEKVHKSVPYAVPKFRLPLPLWREAMAFLYTIFSEKKAEAHVLWYMNPEGNIINRFPYQHGTGGTTNSIECDENYKQLEWLAANNYECIGSIHSHCAMSAFQSGVDKDDEFGNTDGFHVTVGKMNDAIPEIHCRAIVTIMGDLNKGTAARREQMLFSIDNLIDFNIELDKVSFGVNHDIVSRIYAYNLLSPDFLEDISDELFARFTEPPKKSATVVQYGGSASSNAQKWWADRTGQNKGGSNYWTEKRQGVDYHMGFVNGKMCQWDVVKKEWRPVENNKRYINGHLCEFKDGAWWQIGDDEGPDIDPEEGFLGRDKEMDELADALLQRQEQEERDAQAIERAQLDGFGM